MDQPLEENEKTKPTLLYGRDFWQYEMLRMDWKTISNRFDNRRRRSIDATYSSSRLGGSSGSWTWTWSARLKFYSYEAPLSRYRASKTTGICPLLAAVPAPWIPSRLEVWGLYHFDRRLSHVSQAPLNWQKNITVHGEPAKNGMSHNFLSSTGGFGDEPRFFDPIFKVSRQFFAHEPMNRGVRCVTRHIEPTVGFKFQKPAFRYYRNPNAPWRAANLPKSNEDITMVMIIYRFSVRRGILSWPEKHFDQILW